MQEQKPALVETRAQLTWGSCLTIMPNLNESYRRAVGADLLTFEFGREVTSAGTLRTAQRIAETRPSHLVFTDHLRHPYDLLLAMRMSGLEARHWPKLIFHVYGDFTLFTPDWKKSLHILKGKRALFVCASPKQQSFVASFIEDGKQNTSVCPFPVSEKEYHFEPGLRAEARKEWGVSDREFVMIYTGRLSAQKNVLRMIWDVANRCDKAKIPFRFILAGAFDDMASPMFGIRSAPNTYYYGFQKLMEQLPPRLRDRVTYVGQKNKRDLNRFYHGADLFVSFSTHHDEDYGMSPIEALCCGTPALISDWGGFTGFAIDPNSVKLLPVALGSLGPVIDVRHLTTYLQGFYKRSQTESDESRKARSQLFLGSFGIDKGVEIVQTFLNSEIPKLNGFTSKMDKHVMLRAQQAEQGYMFVPGKKVDPHYKMFYRHYATTSSPSKTR